MKELAITIKHDALMQKNISSKIFFKCIYIMAGKQKLFIILIHPKFFIFVITFELRNALIKL
jgi:hypothetical protein